jgi:hypothetical protein
VTKDIRLILANLQNAPNHFRKENIWLGGTIDEEHNWDCPSNWSLNRVPNEEDSVILLGHPKVSNFSPFIGSFVPKIFHLILVNQSELHINSAGKLQIQGNCIEDNAIYLNNSRLVNEGTIHLENPGQKGIEMIDAFLINKGTIQSSSPEADLILANNLSIYQNEGKFEVL